MDTKTERRATEDNRLTSTRATGKADELLRAMAAMPAAHPSRPALRARAIEAWLPLARHLANRYTGRGEPVDDLLQTAVIGLIKAVDKFDPAFGTDFAGYAIPTVIGEIKRHFRDRTWAIRVPRRLQELRLAITAANTALAHTLGRSPTGPPSWVRPSAARTRSTPWPRPASRSARRSHPSTSVSARSCGCASTAT